MTNERIANVRQVLQGLGLDGFLVPQADEHQGEYLSERAQRLHWLTGFAGSAGTAVLYGDRTCLFVDGRYLLQARQQFEGSEIEVRHFREPPLNDWLKDEIKAGDKIGFDANLHGIRQIEGLRKVLAASGAELVPVAENPIDLQWPDQPPPPSAPVGLLDLIYTGQGANDKLAALAETIREAGADASVLNQMESTAWALNVRGGDTANTPLVQSYGVVHSNGHADFYVEPSKLEAGVEAGLGNRITVHDIATFPNGLASLGAAKKTVLLDRDTANEGIRLALSNAGGEIVFGQDPVMMPRACKNDVEIAGAFAAHERDAVAMCRFLRWLDETTAERVIGEIEAGEKLYEFRQQNDLFRGLSFDTISGAAANGAIVHYRVSPESERQLEPGNLFLLDSGGQYLDGTTDITRTVPIGTPSDDMRRHFTLVLKGHSAVARARFPAKATGGQLDAMARQFLWGEGLEYDHGTGHGVGAYLGVHEGPQRMSPNSPSTFKPGMIISNEPGLYITDAYGIRIENLQVVIESPRSTAERKFLEFDTLTVVPIDRRLIDTDMLTPDELAWLDDYHATVREKIGPRLEGADRDWLDKMTAPLASVSG
jgi:Xaa-Pro aminopeptidase